MRFVETHVFTKLVCEALDDDDYGALQITLLLRPEQGPLNTRLRWPPQDALGR